MLYEWSYQQHSYIFIILHSLSSPGLTLKIKLIINFFIVSGLLSVLKSLVKYTVHTTVLRELLSRSGGRQKFLIYHLPTQEISKIWMLKHFVTINNQLQSTCYLPDKNTCTAVKNVIINAVCYSLLVVQLLLY